MKSFQMFFISIIIFYFSMFYNTMKGQNQLNNEEIINALLKTLNIENINPSGRLNNNSQSSNRNSNNTEINILKTSFDEVDLRDSPFSEITERTFSMENLNDSNSEDKTNDQIIEYNNIQKKNNQNDNLTSLNINEIIGNANIDLSYLVGKLAPLIHEGPSFNSQTFKKNSNYSAILKKPAEKEDESKGDDYFQKRIPIITDYSKLENFPLEKTFRLIKNENGQIFLVEADESNRQRRNNSHNETNAVSRQNLQVMSLAQALYSPYSTDRNLMDFNYRAHDGKDGEPGPKGPTGDTGIQGRQGLRGIKGIRGNCQNELLSMELCDKDEIERLMVRVDYLDRVCNKMISPAPFSPQGNVGSDTNPSIDCDYILRHEPNSKSGVYWLMINNKRFQTWCEFIIGDTVNPNDESALDVIEIPKGGWTLVARVKGQASDWSPISDNWASVEPFDEDTSWDSMATESMKSLGYSLVKNNAILVCFGGRLQGCAPFTHRLNVTLAQMFSKHFGIVVDEQYSFASLMKAIGKSCDISALRQNWCGLNVANICDPRIADPNQKPPTTTHVLRIGCIGDKTATCFPDDYAMGIGVTSCKDGFGCSGVGPSKNMHYRCDYVFGAFSQTAFIYVK